MNPQQPITEIEAAKEWFSEKYPRTYAQEDAFERHGLVWELSPVGDVVGFDERVIHIYRKEVIETWKYEYFKDGTWMGRTHSELFEIYRREVLQPEQTISEGESDTVPENIIWNKCSEKPLVDDDGNGRWVQSNYCPTGIFLAGMFVHHNDTGKTLFEWYKVVLTESGLMEVGDDDTFWTGWDIKDFEFWAEVKSDPSPQPDMSEDRKTLEFNQSVNEKGYIVTDLTMSNPEDETPDALSVTGDSFPE